MKKLIATLMTLIVLSIAAVPRVPRPAIGVRIVERLRRAMTSVTTLAAIGMTNIVYQEDRSVWEKHRDKITTAGGAVAGTVLGGLIGGKKGAIIGAITGGAGAAIYTYKIRDKGRRY